MWSYISNMKFFVTFLSCVALAQAQTSALGFAPPYTPSQFSNLGTIQSMTINTPGELFSGGTITIDGITMIVPDNTLVTLPSINALWSELFNENGEVVGFPLWQAPGYGWEATAIGNQVDDDYIVALLFITQSSVRIMQGFVNEIDLETGNFWVSGDSTKKGSGIACRINDPVGRYGLPYTAWPLWAADTDSPSITAATGFPLCIPRFANGTDDPLCPSKNRPLTTGGSQPAHKVNFPAQADRGENDPDSNVTAPLRVGDYVTMNGIDSGGLFLVYLLNANLGFYTAPDDFPAYIVVTDARIAVSVDSDVVHLPETGQVMGTAFTTDPTVPMFYNMMDTDPCTGDETDRLIIPSQPFGNQPGQIFGEALFRPGDIILDPMTRNVGFKMVNGQTVTKNGLIAGQYIQPMFNFILPELTVFGDNMFPINFTTFPYLAFGSGPFISQVAGKSQEPGPIVGRLNPWPGDKTPAATKCPAAPTPAVAQSAAPVETTDLADINMASISAAIAKDTNALGPIPTAAPGPAPFTAEAQAPFSDATPVSQGPNAVITPLASAAANNNVSNDTDVSSAPVSNAADPSTLATVTSAAKFRRQASSTAVATSTAAAAPPDLVTITSVTQIHDMGGFTITINATSSHTTDPLPVLTASGTGDNPLGDIPMISLGGGFYTLSIEMKHGMGLTTITVVSSDGGAETLDE